MAIEEDQIRSLDIYKTLRGPLEAQIELTNACNNACIHCYNYWRGADSIVFFAELENMGLLRSVNE